MTWCILILVCDVFKQCDLMISLCFMSDTFCWFYEEREREREIFGSCGSAGYHQLTITSDIICSGNVLQVDCGHEWLVAMALWHSMPVMSAGASSCGVPAWQGELFVHPLGPVGGNGKNWQDGFDANIVLSALVVSLPLLLRLLHAI